jgi:hypothetical protein
VSEAAPRLERQSPAIARVMHLAMALAFTAAVIGALTPHPVDRAAGGVAVAVIVAAPLVRVAWLGVRWLRLDDRRFALAAFALLGVAAAGTVLALLT